MSRRKQGKPQHLSKREFSRKWPIFLSWCVCVHGTRAYVTPFVLHSFFFPFFFPPLLAALLSNFLRSQTRLHARSPVPSERVQDLL